MKTPEDWTVPCTSRPKWEEVPNDEKEEAANLLPVLADGQLDLVFNDDTVHRRGQHDRAEEARQQCGAARGVRSGDDVDLDRRRERTDRGADTPNRQSVSGTAGMSMGREYRYASPRSPVRDVLME